MHKGENVSCIHPNGASADKEEIRIKSIPVIEDGLSQQEPRGYGCFLQDPLCAVPNHHSTPSEWTRNLSHPTDLVSLHRLRLVPKSPQCSIILLPVNHPRLILYINVLLSIFYLIKHKKNLAEVNIYSCLKALYIVIKSLQHEKDQTLPSEDELPV